MLFFLFCDIDKIFLFEKGWPDTPRILTSKFFLHPLNFSPKPPISFKNKFPFLLEFSPRCGLMQVSHGQQENDGCRKQKDKEKQQLEYVFLEAVPFFLFQLFGDLKPNGMGKRRKETKKIKREQKNGLYPGSNEKNVEIAPQMLQKLPFQALNPSLFVGCLFILLPALQK